MKTKKRAQTFQVLIMLFLFILAFSCKKDDESQTNQTNGKTTAVFNSSLSYGTMTDQDGNTYKTISIGNQTWMAENLRTTHYRNGEAIPNVTDGTLWENLTTGAYCNNCNTTNLDTIATFGRLYNWYALSDSRNIAPKGWHVPTESEWFELISFLGGSATAGEKMKEVGLTHWNFYNTGNNSSGFTALPSGFRTCGCISRSVFGRVGNEVNWWSSTDDEVNKIATYFCLSDVSIGICEQVAGKKNGQSIRCVKD